MTILDRNYKDLMAKAKPVYSATTSDDGSITIDLGNGKDPYTFTEPVGKTLVLLEKYKVTNPDSTEIEDMAYLMSILEVEGLDVEHFLGLPLKLFKFIASELNQFFRLDDE